MKARLLFAALFTAGCLTKVVQAAEPSVPPTPAASDAIKLPDTLMFTIDEYNDIQGHLARTDDGEKAAGHAIEDASLYLSTILYLGPEDWTIWVNGVPISADQEFQAFKITQITPNYVELLVPLSAQGMRPVRLGPNQTFITKTGIVVEGNVH